ncbi:MAG: hypothetical protein KBT02_07075 [Treponema sp.]|nr:hypothetical protein [Candidatus Treponema caballi]
MDERLQSAYNLEKSGEFQAALDAYLQFEAVSGADDVSLSSDDRLFLARSIAACFYYLKDYPEAEKRFERILADTSLSAETADEVESCLYLCWLYGGQAEKAKAAFQKRVQVRASAWDYWYLGQCCLHLHEYAEMVDYYEDAVRCAESVNSDKVPFFMCHLVVADLLNNRMDEVGRLLNRLAFMQKATYGLFGITSALYAKMRGSADWKKQYSAGLRQAKKCGYHENVELAEFLLKELG